SSTCMYVYFFFQAEDGIRDRNVTGVQTCALPIFSCHGAAPPTAGVAWLWERKRLRATKAHITHILMHGFDDAVAMQQRRLTLLRSEERRVGKECGSRGLGSVYIIDPQDASDSRVT